MAFTKRVQVLMEPAEFQQLEAIALSEGLGVGELLRRAARLHYLRSPGQRQSAAKALIDLGLPAITDLTATGTAARSSTP